LSWQGLHTTSVHGVPGAETKVVFAGQVFQGSQASWFSSLVKVDPLHAAQVRSTCALGWMTT